jgi:hypothetical protein
MLSTSAIAPAGVAAANPTKDVNPRHIGTDYNNGVALALKNGEEKTAQPPLGPGKVGQVRTWLALDDGDGTPAHPSGIYLKNYTMRGTGPHSEVWVANNLNFQAGDCRNGLLNGISRVTITNDQVSYLIAQFEGNMYPTESAWWGVPPDRDGHNALLPKLIPNIPSSEYKGEGDNIVILVDNVRDSNYWDLNNTQTNSYIAGFFYSVFNDYFNRNVMTVDAFDWFHRTGADPITQPTADPCTSAPARPFLYESVFAHEYQHLIHHYSDPNEVNWVNEGMSDFTEVITGYADLTKHVNQKGHDSHTNAFLGWEAVVDPSDPSWNPIPYESGPENGLTFWGDQGDDEILADYGFAMFFMNYVYQQGYGQTFFNIWHHTAANGIDGMNEALAAVSSSDTFASLFSDASVSALVDAYLDNGGTTGDSALDANLQNLATEATVNINPDANGTVGAPPWGSDYVDLGSGAALSSVSVAFEGANHYVGGPQWVVDTDGYFTNPDAIGTNYGDNVDVSIARPIDVTGAGALTFKHYRAMELGWDFGFVQKSTDGGATWTSVACGESTTSDHNVDAAQNIVDNLPGFTGPSEDTAVTTTIGTALEPITETCQLGNAAGPMLISFRLMTDPGAEFDGWHVKDIQLDGVDVGTPGSLAGWDNQLFFLPVELTFAFALVGVNGTVDAWGDVAPAAGGTILVFRPTLVNGAYTLTPEQVLAFAGYGRVVAIVSGIPDSESTSQYQPYTLLVDGAEKADGA